MKFRNLLILLGLVLLIGTSFAMDPVIDQDQMEVVSVNQDILTFVNLDSFERGDVLNFKESIVDMILICDTEKKDIHGIVTSHVRIEEKQMITSSSGGLSEVTKSTSVKSVRYANAIRTLSLFYTKNNDQFNKSSTNCSSGGLPGTSALML